MGAAFYSIGALYPPDTVSLVFPRPAPPPPSSDSEEGMTKTATIESEIQILPEILAFRRRGDEYYESRPHIHFPEERRVFTGRYSRHSRRTNLLCLFLLVYLGQLAHSWRSSRSWKTCCGADSLRQA